jgi:hypothetical protein
MKNFNIIIISFFIAMNLLSQTFQPKQQKLNYLGYNIYLDSHQDFKQDSFELGWHWAAGYKMSKSLSINQIHVSTEFPAYKEGPLYYINPNFLDTMHIRIANNAKMIMNTPYISASHWSGFPISRNLAIQYEPTYQVDLSTPAQSFERKPYDTTKYAFGFGTVRGFIPIDSTDINYNRLLLRTDSMTGGSASQVVSTGSTTGSTLVI